MRAFWTLIIACLLAATGAYPSHAAPRDADETSAQLRDRNPATPAVSATPRAARLLASRPAPPPSLQLAVLAEPPVPLHFVPRAVRAALHACLDLASAPAPSRSARGPPPG